MRISYYKYLFYSLSLMLVTLQLVAQAEITSWLDIGKTNVSEGGTLKSSVLGGYSFDMIRVDGGLQIEPIGNAANLFTGLSLFVSREFTIRKFRFETSGYFLYNRFSDLVIDYNWGILAGQGTSHFLWKFGLNFRTYHITRTAVEEYGIEENRNLHENWNLVYLIGYNLKPAIHPWNAGISITNMDYFFINQETNPMLFLRGSYKVTPPIGLFAEAWIKSAGALNLSTNFFGFFIRTGIIWKPDLKN